MSNVIALRTAEQPSPISENGKVTSRRRNAELRKREYLTESEVDRLMLAAGEGRYAQRDRTMVLLMFRHGLRAGEAVALRWDAVDLKAGTIHVARLKNGTASVHPLRGPELRALRQLKRDWPDSPYLFASERGGPMTGSNIRKLVARLGRAAGLGPVHPHQLRHACGYALVNKGTDMRALQAYLGHRNIQHTVRYAELAPGRFKDLWRD